MTQGPSLTERLAERLARPVDPATRARARLHLLDWLGCVAGARRSEVAAATALEPNPALRAAWLGNLLEMDDVHRAALLHPGPVVWPAVLCFPEPTLRQALDAAVCGYEATVSIGLAFDAYHYAHYHPTATAGTIGAAAAAASLRSLDSALLAQAMGLAGSVTGGLWRMRHESGMAKQWHLAHAARTGIEAALHVARGVTGPRFILEGEQGLFAATCHDPRPEIMFGPAKAWRIGEVSFKPWPACRHAHPTIDAALELGDALAQGPVQIATYRDALTFCDKPDPRTPIEAKFSLQHAIAVVAVRGAPTLADFEPAAIANPAIAAARTRVQVTEDPALTARYPAHFGAHITAGGRTATAPDAWGDPENPLTPADVTAKARALMRWGEVPDADADRLIDLALNAPDNTPLAGLDVLAFLPSPPGGEGRGRGSERSEQVAVQA